MSLLDDLNSIDVSAVVDAKGVVALVLQNDDLQRLIDQGPARTVLGDLGTILDSLEGDLSEPETYVAPLLSAVGSVAGKFSFDNSDVNTAIQTVGDGARILADALGGVSGDLATLKTDSDLSILDRFGKVTAGSGDFARKAIGAIGKRRALLDLADRGFPSDPSALRDAAIDVLLPFPRDQLATARGALDGVLAGLDAISLPTTRVEGLVSLMADLRVRAEAVDAAGVQALLDQVAARRSATIEAMSRDLRQAAQRFEALRLDQSLRALTETVSSLRSAELGAIEELAEWRDLIAGAGPRVGTIDVDAIRAFVDDLFVQAETFFTERYEAGVEAQVDKLEAWLRSLLAELPIRSLRDKITNALRDATDAIEGAELDRVATEIRSQIQDLSDLIETVDLEALIDAATAALADAIRGALDQVEAALDDIVATIEALLGQVEAVLGQALDGLKSFREAIDEITAAIAAVDIEGAAQAVVLTLRELREAAEKLLSAAPLPDALRDEVAALAEQVAAIDVEGLVRQPLQAAVDALRIPDDAAGIVEDGLAKVAEIVENLIPENIAGELQAELDGLFGQLDGLDLGALTGGIGDELDKLAGLLEGVDLVAAVAPAEEVFDTARDALARLRPSKLLEPVIEAYDGILGRLPTPDPRTISERAGTVMSGVGEPAARAATAPVRALAGQSDATPQDGGTPSGPSPQPPGGVRPGDLVRLVGFLPARLREALEGLEAGAAGDVMAGMQSLCGDLAADIRGLQVKLVEIDRRIDESLDAMLRTLSRTRAETQVSLRVAASAHPGAFDLDASLSILATLDASNIRNAILADLRILDSRLARARTGVAGDLSARLDEVAELLENCALARFGGDLDALMDALDVEPIATALDTLFADLLASVASVSGGLEADLRRYEAQLRALIARFNPGAQAQKFLRALNVLREQLDLLNPRRLADELDEVFLALLGDFDAYRPSLFAAGLQGLLTSTAVAVRGLDPGALSPNFAPIEAQVARVPALLPIDRLLGVGVQLDVLGAEMRAIDVDGLIASVNELRPQVAAGVEIAVKGIKDEILALLESIRFTSTNASASASVSVGVGG